MARLTKEERRVFDPSLLIQNQKWKSDTIKDLTIGDQNVAAHPPGQPGPPAPVPSSPWPPGKSPAPSRDDKLAHFLTPSGSGKTLSDEWYEKGLETIMQTTEPGSGMREERLDILNHQYLDQVRNPLKINQKVAHHTGDKHFTEPSIDELIQGLINGDVPRGTLGDEETENRLIQEYLNKQSLKIGDQKVAMADKMYRVTDWDKKQNNEAWKQFMKGNPNYFYKPVKGKA